MASFYFFWFSTVISFSKNFAVSQSFGFFSDSSVCSLSFCERWHKMIHKGWYAVIPQNNSNNIMVLRVWWNSRCLKHFMFLTLFLDLITIFSNSKLWFKQHLVHNCCSNFSHRIVSWLRIAQIFPLWFYSKRNGFSPP